MKNFHIYRSLLAAYNLEECDFNADLVENKDELTTLIKIASYNRIEQNLINFIDQNKLNIPNEYYVPLKERGLSRTLKSISCLQSGIQTAEILSEHNVDYIFQKALAMYTYDQNYLERRPSSDVDIFIRKEQLELALDALIQHGYRFNTKYPFNNASWEGCLENRPDVILKDNNNNLIEIHTSLFKGKHKVDSDFECIFLKENIIQSTRFRKLFAPSHENYILHLIYNYTKHSFYTSGIKYLLDIYDLNNSKMLDWSYILKKSKGINILNETHVTINAMVKLKLLPYEILSNFSIPPIQDKYVEKSLSLSFENYSSENYTVLLGEGSVSKAKFLFNNFIFPSRSKLSYRFNIHTNSKLKLLAAYMLHLYGLITNSYNIFMKAKKHKKYDVQELNKRVLKSFLQND